ncbi:MAG: YabP/YqfC family sporulation protein [Firmicutes bacterium]|nr:YabP/YqfC family sporulation protein [Bacillota bacterium]MBQ9604933.1 YabP/YqfC family sporulation protein [Bacillota bacterium]
MQEEAKKHVISMSQRRHAEITGVTDVLSFDEECIVADTVEGALVFRGRDLHITNLNLDRGELCVDGEFTGVSYEESVPYKSGLFGRIFR